MFRWLNKSESCYFGRYKFDKKLSAAKCIFFSNVRPKSYYQVLGIDSTASPKEIKSAYYKLSLQFHPDKNDGCPEAVTKFREITEAYEVLGNPEKKTKYDSKVNFQSSYTPGDYYYGRDSRTYYRPKKHNGPFTGKSNHFDYDEHYRQHYQEYEKRRQAEHEYFKRRWEAEFYRRYPNFEDYYQRKPIENFDPYETFAKSRRRLSFMIFLTVWALLFIIQGIQEFLNPETLKIRKPIYYSIKKEESKEKNDS